MTTAEQIDTFQGFPRITATGMAFPADPHGPERSPSQERYRAPGERPPPDEAPARSVPGVAAPAGRMSRRGPARQPQPAETDVLLDHHLNAGSARFTCGAPVPRRMMERAGLSNIVRCGLNESEDPALRGLAYEGRMPDGFPRLECPTLEGTRPQGRAAEDPVRQRALPAAAHRQRTA